LNLKISKTLSLVTQFFLHDDLRNSTIDRSFNLCLFITFKLIFGTKF